MTKTLVKVGPADHGKQMSLEDFDKAHAQEGYWYELSQGVIVVSDVPKRRHLNQVNEIRFQLTAYWVLHRPMIHTIAAGNECKILLPELESERHPDLAVYKTSSADHDEQTVWRTWIPEIVIEVVSLGSEIRDYQEKREEYLRFGVKEYWIVDAERQEVLALKRRGNSWRAQVVRPPQTYSTRLLAGFALDVAAVFAAAAQVPE